jgi:hypothetical protein
MGKDSGSLVRYIDSDGQVRQGIVKHSEQSEEFKKYNKVLIRLLNNDMTVKKDEHGKEIVVLKDSSKVIITGFID